MTLEGPEGPCAIILAVAIDPWDGEAEPIRISDDQRQTRRIDAWC
jgi:hypothetical protein